MPVVYTLQATEVPAIQVPSDVLDPLASAKYPPVTTKLEFGDPASKLVPICQEMAVRIDSLSRYGGGGVGVLQGLDISDGGGLAAAISTGAAGIDGLVILPETTSVVLTDDARNHLWFAASGDVFAVVGSLLPPDEALYCYLGSVLTASGAIAEIDYSGRMEIRGGLLLRRTGDASKPADTPPATVRFLHESGDGVYLWDGQQYRLVTSENATGIYKAKVDVDDLPDYLWGKFEAGENITLTKTTDSSKKIRIDAQGNPPGGDAGDVVITSIGPFAVAVDVPEGKSVIVHVDHSEEATFGLAEPPTITLDNTAFQAVLLSTSATGFDFRIERKPA